MAVNVNTLLTTTLFHQSKEISDELTKSDAILTQLSSRDRIVKVAGGYELREPCMYQGPTIQWFDGMEQLNTTQAEVATVFQYDWALCSVPIVISKKEELMNSDSEERMLDLLDTRVQAARAGLKNGVATALRADGTTAKSMVGLAGLLPSTNTGTIGGIARSSNTMAQHVIYSFASNLSKAWSAATIQEGLLANWMTTTRGNDGWDLLLATQTPFGCCHQSLTAIQRITKDSELAKAGFRTLEYMGGEMVLDTGFGETAATELIYALNTNYIKLKVHRDFWMQALGSPREPVDQAGTIKFLGGMGALTVSAPNFLARIAA
jgi:hypothetical protein